MYAQHNSVNDYTRTIVMHMIAYTFKFQTCKNQEASLWLDNVKM